MQIGINIEQTTTHNFTKLNVKILSILFFTVPKLVEVGEPSADINSAIKTKQTSTYKVSVDLKLIIY